MWLTNRGDDDGHMLVGMGIKTMESHGYMGACSFVIHFSFSVCTYMPTITTTGAHTSHAQLCFCSTNANLICLSTPGYVALGTHYLLCHSFSFTFFLII